MWLLQLYTPPQTERAERENIKIDSLFALSLSMTLSAERDETDFARETEKER